MESTPDIDAVIESRQEAKKEDETLFAEASQRWVRSLKDRHDKLGIYSVLDHNVRKYPAQALDKVIYRASYPDSGKVAELGRSYVESAEVEAMEGIRNGARIFMGPSYDKFVEDFVGQRTNPEIPESMLKSIWGRTSTPNKPVAVIMEHTDLMAPALIMAALTDAFSRAEFAKAHQHYFNLFSLTHRNYLFLNKSLAFLGVADIPAVDLASPITNQVMVVPPTRNTLRMGVPKTVAKSYKQAFDIGFQGEQALLASKNQSMIMYISPSASTSEKYISPKTAELLTGSLALPVSLVLSPEPKWYIGRLESIKQPHHVNEIMAHLDDITLQLRANGVADKLGGLSIAST